jgi:acetone carboxylase gamma subunit
MEQELFQNVKTFLEKEKECSNVESEVPIKERSSQQFKIRGIETIPIPIDFGHIDVVGGKFYKKDPEDLRYIGIELHCIEYKSPNDDIIKGIGQIFWYKFAMSKLTIWTERLFLYLMVHEDKVSEELKEFCKTFGIGLLRVNSAKIITEIVTPENQHGFVSRQARDKTEIECQQCNKSFVPKDLICPDCGTSLEAKAPWFWHLFADEFGASSTNRKYQGVPDSMPKEVEETPMLKKVFGNWSKVKEAWRKGG